MQHLGYEEAHLSRGTQKRWLQRGRCSISVCSFNVFHVAMGAPLYLATGRAPNQHDRAAPCGTLYYVTVLTVNVHLPLVLINFLSSRIRGPLNACYFESRGKAPLQVAHCDYKYCWKRLSGFSNPLPISLQERPLINALQLTWKTTNM